MKSIAPQPSGSIRTRHARLLLTVAALGLSAVAIQSSTPKFFQSATQSDFLQGDIENLSIDSRGQLQLGPATNVVYETPAPFLWTILSASDGTLFIGSGNEGRVFRVDPQGRGSAFFDAGELEVHALAQAPNGGLYAASSPDGKIYRIDRNGAASTFFDPDDKYIWALATDAKGNLYAGTGDKGLVYKIAPDGKGTVFYSTKATHVTALAFDKTGNLMVGTESPGKLFRVDQDGKGFLGTDTPFDEIHTLRIDESGFLYVAAMSGRPGAGGAPPTSTDTTSRSTPDPTRTGIPTVTIEVSSATLADSSSAGPGSTPDDRRTPRGAVYRVAPDGVWDQIWESRDDVPYDVVLDREGRPIVATGSKGKIYRLEGNPPKPTLLARASAQQVTALYRNPQGAVFYATANPGKLFRLSSDLATEGTYISDVQDAKMLATWGALNWRGAANGGRLEVSTRSGNSQTPDDAWSAWSAAYATSGSAITSPKARYLQWRVTLSGRAQSPILTSINAAFLQRNLRPEVRSITVHPPGIVFQKPFPSGDPDLAGFDNQSTPDRKLASDASAPQGQSGSPSLGRRAYEKGLETLVWRADDENGDELIYDIEYRREGDAAWKPLRRGLRESIYVWDTATVPNGTYFVRVEASDAPSNGADSALVGELDSVAFDIDNTPPVFSPAQVRVAGGQTIVTFDVTDDHSPIQRVESSRDGYDWVPVFPKDGIADSRTEHYELSLDGALGPRGLSLRATDTLNNVATSHVDAP